MLAPLNHINAVDRSTRLLPCYGGNGTRCIWLGNRFNLMSRERLINSEMCNSLFSRLPFVSWILRVGVKGYSSTMAEFNVLVVIYVYHIRYTCMYHIVCIVCIDLTSRQ